MRVALLFAYRWARFTPGEGGACKKEENYKLRKILK